MKQMKLEVYESPMSCSCGICGLNVNPDLVRFSRDLEWLKTQNVEVVRHHLSSNPAAFAHPESVKDALEDEGNECLPLVLVNGYIASKSIYPSRDELLTFIEIAANANCNQRGTDIPDPGSQCCRGGGKSC